MLLSFLNQLMTLILQKTPSFTPNFVTLLFIPPLFILFICLIFFCFCTLLSDLSVPVLIIAYTGLYYATLYVNVVIELRSRMTAVRLCLHLICKN